MDELEFCLKSISYPLGMLLEGKERKTEDAVRVSRETITLPEVPFGALCYLTGLALFDSLELVDKKRLAEDYDRLEVFKKKLLASKLGENLKPYLTNPGLLISPLERLSFDWLEFQRRKEKVESYLKRLRELIQESRSRNEYLDRASFVEELTVDEGLLLGYLAESEKERELINSALGKHNPDYREMAKRYFKALRG
ncbi:hypothetical protein [Thermococcus peptonophilus]|uniref:Uncharacterized protein n=1 Tax=Thermococcus peptonophilus TaxID=53952 RepID=A0A142CW05_9EURY|nr:hypothetical protein [Thermococcus peptonophilus]AMQ18957.1 hypothetical protein A0127_07125 [Thermococcus peptonophilus]